MHMPYDEPTFGVTVEGYDGDAVVVVRGELDLGTVVQLQDCIDRVRRPGHPITIDLSETTFMDSSGVNLLLRARQSGGGRHDAVQLRSPSEPVVATLALAGIADLFLTIGTDGTDGAHRHGPAEGASVPTAGPELGAGAPRVRRRQRMP